MKNWKIIAKVPDDLKADIDAFRDADDLIRWFNLTGQPQNHPLFQKYSAQIFSYYSIRLAEMCRREEIVGSPKLLSGIC